MANGDYLVLNHANLMLAQETSYPSLWIYVLYGLRIVKLGWNPIAWSTLLALFAGIKLTIIYPGSSVWAYTFEDLTWVSCWKRGKLSGGQSYPVVSPQSLPEIAEKIMRNDSFSAGRCGANWHKLTIFYILFADNIQRITWPQGRLLIAQSSLVSVDPFFGLYCPISLRCPKYPMNIYIYVCVYNICISFP